MLGRCQRRLSKRMTRWINDRKVTWRDRDSAKALVIMVRPQMTGLTQAIGMES